MAVFKHLNINIYLESDINSSLKYKQSVTISLDKLEKVKDSKGTVVIWTRHSTNEGLVK